jgi:UDP-glucose 4-epimerase
MAVRRVCEALVHGRTFPLYGDGLQSRDLTYVADVCDATCRAALARVPMPIYNVGGGGEATLLAVIGTLAQLAGTQVDVQREPRHEGDVRRTAADVRRARESLGWRPTTSLEQGLALELDWCRSRVHEWSVS